MGHRVMETHNLHGKTAARHLVPRAVRRSRKRALRMAATSPQMAATSPKPIKPARPRRQVLPSVEHVVTSVDTAQPLPAAARRSWKQVLGIAAKTQETAPVPLQPEHTIPLEAPQPVPTAPRVRKQEVRIAAKVQKPTKPPKRAKPSQPGAPSIPQPQSETEAQVDEARPMSTDRLEDGVVEWGIKREGEKDPKS
jgi:hypothetical protein